MDRTVTFKQEETSGHEPQPGLDTKTDRLTDRQSQCDFDSDKHKFENNQGLLVAYQPSRNTQDIVRINVNRYGRQPGST
jgi:hypothetical protein